MKNFCFVWFTLAAWAKVGRCFLDATGHRRMAGRNHVMKEAISPQRSLFFEIVESGLTDRYCREDINRVFTFCDYAKLITSLPSVDKYMHEPCEEFINGLTAKPWWDAQDFDWTLPLETFSESIADELSNVLSAQEVFRGDSRYMNTMGAGWTAFRLQRFGEWNETNVAKFPKTSSIVRSLNIPLAVRGVMFAKQSPRSGVQPHSDGRNFILTAHLGLKVPTKEDACWISVAGEKRPWKKNEVIVFDTSFVHETANDSDEDRYVLIIDFWHPELTPPEREALQFIYDCRNKFDGGRASEIDCSYVRSGKPLTVDKYLEAKNGFGKKFMDLFKF